MRKRIPIWSAILALLLAGCVAPAAPPAVQPPPLPPPATDLPTPLSPTPTATPAIDVPPTEVEQPAASSFDAIAGAAVQFAAAELGVDPASIQVLSVDAVEWRNSCLGVDKPDEMCLDVITPGYRVLLDVNGQEVAVHTNQDARVMRLADPAQGAPSVKPVSTPWDPAEIYALVVRQLYTVDHTFGQPPLFPVVYLLRQTDDSVSASGAPSNSQTIFPGDQQRITSLLADLPADFVWVDSREDVPLDSVDVVAGGGAMITLGNISQQPDGALHTPASIYVGSLAAGGRTYVLEAVDGVWQITGVSGPVWMS
jgi:hypothetical protein